MNKSINNEVRTEPNEDNSCLAFRKLVKENGDTCFTFTWIKDNGRLSPGYGQVEIPNEKVLVELLLKAMKEGWFDINVIDFKKYVTIDKIESN